MSNPATYKEELTDRAFSVRAVTRGFRRKIIAYTISDGLNDITIPPHDWFVVYTDEPLSKAIIKRR